MSVNCISNREILFMQIYFAVHYTTSFLVTSKKNNTMNTKEIRSELANRELSILSNVFN
jgi:hypothetical protein